METQQALSATSQVAQVRCIRKHEDGDGSAEEQSHLIFSPRPLISARSFLLCLRCGIILALIAASPSIYLPPLQTNPHTTHGGGATATVLPFPRLKVNVSVIALINS